MKASFRFFQLLIAMTLPAITTTAFAQIYSVTGRVRLSVDAFRSIAVNDSGIQIAQKKAAPDKRPGETVHAAFLFAASARGSGLPSGVISLEGTPLTWDSTWNNAGLWMNGCKDVTSMVAPLIDACPAGICTLIVDEASPLAIDGEILAVFFDTPSDRTSNLNLSKSNINRYQSSSDGFDINLDNPANLSDSTFHVSMGLGISGSNSCDCGTGGQYSTVDVEGMRISSSAGGCDDGDSSSGTQLTVGDFRDDASTNPFDALATPCDLATCSQSYDDEAYDLTSYVNEGDLVVHVNIDNPSDNHNIFFVWSVVKGDDQVLPVELTSFEAIPGDGRVTLNWTTASETSNDRFELLRDDVRVANVHATNRATGSSYSWTDYNAVNGTMYTYTLVSVDMDGMRENLRTVNATPNSNSAVISEYALYQNFPNPFNPMTSIGYSIPEAGLVNLAVFDLNGRMVAALVNREQNAGSYSVEFNGENLSSSVYYYRLTTNSFSATQKMVLMK